ncbi:MAG: uL15 family ribosomal protein [Candidatus Nanoarchaeia archaeon]
MVVRKKKSSRKFRGWRTHGTGFGKRHRGKGNKPYRGGGVGKRGAHRETIFLSKKVSAIGKRGIQVMPRVRKEKLILVKLSDLEKDFAKFVNLGVIKGNREPYEVDLSLLGNVKLLSNGKITKKFNIRVPYFTAKAKEKVEAVGGTIIKTQ